MGFLVFLLLVFIFIVIVQSFFVVQQKTAKVVQRFGRFNRVALGGLRVKLPFFIDRVAGTLSLRVQQLDVRIETKTKDNVFVNVVVSVQFYVIPGKIKEAFYSLENPELQIRSYVYDVVRARVPTIKLDNVFETKDEVAQAVKVELMQTMDDFGLCYS